MNETDCRKSAKLSINSRHKEVLPAPEGAETTNRVPVRWGGVFGVRSSMFDVGKSRTYSLVIFQITDKSIQKSVQFLCSIFDADKLFGSDEFDVKASVAD